MSNVPEQDDGGTGPELVPVAEAARHYGITERAVRKRIAAGTLRGMMIDRAWHVYIAEPIAEPEQGRSSAGSRNRNSSDPVPPPSVATQQPAAAIMQEWIAPLAARIEALARENGELEADLRHERARRESVEHDYEVAKKEVAALRLLARQSERRQPEAPERPAAVSAEGIPLAKMANVAPGGAGEAEQMPEKPQRWPWWMRLLAGK